MQNTRDGAGCESGQDLLEGQAVNIVLLKRNGIVYECIRIEHALRLHYLSSSYLRWMCDTGKLISIKYKNIWYVERNLSQGKIDKSSA